MIGVIVEGRAKAYPINDLSADRALEDTVGDKKITLSYDAAKSHQRITGPDGEEIPSVQAFWFAWAAFYPDTDLWKP